MNKFVAPIAAMLMWAAGTGLVLITLSGKTQDIALQISIVALIINIIAIYFEVTDKDG